MGFTAAKCEQCGGRLLFDNSKNVFFCERCSTPYVFETTGVPESADRHIELACQWEMLGEDAKALDEYWLAVDIEPLNASV